MYTLAHSGPGRSEGVRMAPVTTEAIAVHVGPSGCGKSTLLKILAGILPASSGDARLRGTLIDGPRRDIVLKWHVIKDELARGRGQGLEALSPSRGDRMPVIVRLAAS